MPLVSVIISIYNENFENWVLSINSILNQTYKNIEIIVIDDGSSPKIELPNKFINKVKLLQNKRNFGLAYSLNKALNYASGKYILRLDSDDFAILDRIEIQVKFLELNADVQVVGSSLYVMNEKNQLLGLRSIVKYDNLLKKNYWKEIPIPHPSWLIRKEWFNQNLYNTNLLRGQDQYLLIKNLNSSTYYVISKPLTCYRTKNISLRKRFSGRLSIISGVIIHKKIYLIIFFIIYHLSAFARDIIFKFYSEYPKIWNVKPDENDFNKFNQTLNSIK